jgi:DMSO/TMAO reductase YedYZ heme-binding membrane subunit
MALTGMRLYDEKASLMLSALASVLIVLLVWLFYVSGEPLSLTRLLNKILASSGTIMIALSFLLGPLGKFMKLKPEIWVYRKNLGMFGFGLIALHALISLSFSSPFIFTAENTLFLASGALSFIIFSVLAAASSSLVIEGLGYENWVKIQRTGYFALLLALVHFALREQFMASLLGQLIFTFVSITILARLYLLVKK